MLCRSLSISKSTGHFRCWCVFFASVPVNKIHLNLLTLLCFCGETWQTSALWAANAVSISTSLELDICSSVAASAASSEQTGIIRYSHLRVDSALFVFPVSPTDLSQQNKPDGKNSQQDLTLKLSFRGHAVMRRQSQRSCFWIVSWRSEVKGLLLMFVLWHKLKELWILSNRFGLSRTKYSEKHFFFVYLDYFVLFMRENGFRDDFSLD